MAKVEKCGFDCGQAVEFDKGFSILYLYLPIDKQSCFVMRKTLTYLLFITFIIKSCNLLGQNNLEQYAFGFDFVEGIFNT